MSALIDAIAKKCKHSKRTVMDVYRATFDTIVNSLAEDGKPISIAGFGRFFLSWNLACYRRDKETGEIVKLGPTRRIRFEPTSGVRRTMRLTTKPELAPQPKPKKKRYDDADESAESGAEIDTDNGCDIDEDGI